MLEKIKTSDKVLFLITFVLLCLYVVSFTKSCSSTDKREMVKSALVNKKYEDKITMFQLQQNGTLLTLSKKNENWFVENPEMPSISLPGDKIRMEKFISDLISIQEMYKVSTNIDKNSAFGLTDSSAFDLRYYFGDDFNDIVFGNQDFTLSSRYIMSGKATTVYEISNIFDKYLTTSVQSWTEPFIISQEILGPIKSGDIQRVFVTYNGKTSQPSFNSKFLDLRHGGFPTTRYFSQEMFADSNMTIKLELGNRKSLLMKIAQSGKSDEQEFYVETQYFDQKDNLVYKSYSKISGWTYDKIKEIML